jgi:ATP-binding cassette subfamily B protein
VERATLRRILTTIAPYRSRALLVGIAIVACALLNLIPPIFVKKIVDEAIPAKDVHRLAWLCAGMIAGPLLAGLIGVGQKYLAIWIGERVMFDLRVELFRHLHRQSLGFFSSAKPGEAVSRVLNDVKGVGDVMSSTVVDVIQNSVILLSTVVLIFWLDWRLALLATAMLPLFIAPTRRVGQRRKEIKREAQAETAELTGILTETLSVSGALLLKVFGTEEKEALRFQSKAKEIMDLQLQQSLVGRWFNMLLGLFEDFGPAMMWLAGGFLVILGLIPLGTVMAFIQVLKKRLYSPATALANVHVDLVVSYAYFDRIFQVLDMKPSIVDAPDAVKLRDVRGEVAFRHVHFAYGADDHTLTDIDVVIPPGKSLALVGPSGAGKSTIAALLPRLYDPTEGSVTLDGVDLRKIQLESLRSHISVVTQETFLFHASVLENLRYGRPGATDEEVEAAARSAQIHDLIEGLPQGYGTIVGERGYRFSGGERQRLAIARAILKNPRILILDEATSALDSANETLVQRALEPLLEGRTSLIIAHRLSTIRKADTICVLQAGRVVERGTHDELLALGGLFSKLHRDQLGQESSTAIQSA